MKRLGVIGMSEGNGHPYSWSAIFNGYDREAMATCPFPVIPKYLARQTFPEDCVPGARVTHIWTQDRTVSEHIARAWRITNVVSDYRELIGEVDAVLLARDDADLHYEMSEPFLRAGLPVYIDKPLSTSVAEANRIYALERYPGQIFSCSALRYSHDLSLTAEMRESIGDVVHVSATVMKYWDTYGVHIIEPALRILGVAESAEHVSVSPAAADRRTVCATWADGRQAVFSVLGAMPASISIRVFGTKGNVELTFGDTFHAFREALRAFLIGVQEGRAMIPRADVLRVVDLIERGRR